MDFFPEMTLGDGPKKPRIRVNVFSSGQVKMSVNQFGYQDIKISISGDCGHVRYGQRENDFYNARSDLREARF